MSDHVPLWIETLKIENRSFEQILTTKTFYSDVRLSPVKYRDAWTKKWKIRGNANLNKFFLGFPIESRNILRCSKLKKQIQAYSNNNNFWIFWEFSSLILSISIYYGTQSYIRVKNYCRFILLGFSVFNFEQLNTLRESIWHTGKNLLLFEFPWIFRF